MERFVSRYEDVCAADKKAFLDKNQLMQEVPSDIIDRLEAEFDKRKTAILNTESKWELGAGGFVRYVSMTDGDDSNDGLTPETAWKTIDKIHEAQSLKTVRAGDVVLFKRGDEWHGKLRCAAGVTFSAYGEGPKPRLLGSTEADRPDQWLETDTPDIYKFSEKVCYKNPAGNNTRCMGDVGNIVFNDGECYGMRVIKDPNKDVTLHAGSDHLVSNGIKQWLFPPREFSDYRDLKKIADDIPEADLMYYEDLETGELFLYSRDGNPGKRFWSVELCIYGNALHAYSGVTIDNLCIKYTGSHGVGAGSSANLTVRNCEIGWIGGSIQFISPNGGVVRYGNAVEIYGKANGFYVYNNYIYQCFDCGPTAQWAGALTEGKQIISRDIHFYDNVLREASLEVWYSTRSEITDSTYCKLINCRMYNNMVTGSGTGFKAYNHQKYEWCSFYGGPTTNAPYIDCYMEDNYFWGERRHLMKCVPTTTMKDHGFIWQNNVIIHPKDEGSIGLLGEDYASGRGRDVQYFYDEETVRTLVDTGTFGFNYFYYTPGDKANKRKFGG